jgi:hypothetical protein
MGQQEYENMERKINKKRNVKKIINSRRIDDKDKKIKENKLNKKKYKTRNKSKIKNTGQTNNFIQKLRNLTSRQRNQTVVKIENVNKPVISRKTEKSKAAKLIQEKFRKKLEHDLKKASNVSTRKKNKKRCKNKFDAMKKFIDEQEKVNNKDNTRLIHKNSEYYTKMANKYKHGIPVKKYMACMGDSPFTPTSNDISYFSEIESRSGSRSTY